jgi:hypothetical protein
MMTRRPTTAAHVRRTIAAPPERVYRAWLDPLGTQPDLTHERLDRLDGLRDHSPDIAEQVGPGWESAPDALVAVGW